MGQRIRDEILYVQQRNGAKVAFGSKIVLLSITSREVDFVHVQGGMMEEWHQKLHNNTSPDDVVICEALINFIQANMDITRYWQTLQVRSYTSCTDLALQCPLLDEVLIYQAANISKERLASFDRPIVSEPAFKPEQSPQLVKDLQSYLVTLKAVHSGADLQAAAAAVLGYKHESVKGRSIHIDPLPNVATPRLQAILETALQVPCNQSESL